MIAVKKLVENPPMGHEKTFSNEVGNLMAVQHENIVKLVGFCHESQKKLVPHNGRYIIVDITEVLLCYEYLPNGSLDNLVRNAIVDDNGYYLFPSLFAFYWVLS